MDRVFGPTLGAGVRVEDVSPEQSIEASQLGTTAYLGWCERGSTTDLIRCRTAQEFLRKCGRRSGKDGFYLADAAYHFYELAGGAGELWVRRVVDGNEVKATLPVYGRTVGLYPGSTHPDLGGVSQLKRKLFDITMKYGGRSGGRWAFVNDVVAGAGSIAATAITTGKTMLVDQYKGATLYLMGVPTKTYVVTGNTTAGVVSVEDFNNMSVDHANGDPADLEYVILLDHDSSGGRRRGLAVQFSDGVLSPGSEFGMAIFYDGLKIFEEPDLSWNPSSQRYFKTVVEARTDNYEITIENVATLDAAAHVRPANWYSEVQALTESTITGSVCHITSITSAAREYVREFTFPAGAATVPHTLTLTYVGPHWTVASDMHGALPNATPGTAYTAKNIYTVGFTVFSLGAGPTADDVITIEVLPFDTDLSAHKQPVKVTPDCAVSPRTKYFVEDNTPNTLTLSGASLVTDGTAEANATVTTTLPETYNIGATTDTLLISVDGEPDVTVTLTNGAARTAAQIVTDINTAFLAAFQREPASVVVVGGVNYVALTSQSPDWSGTRTSVQIKTVADNGYAILGLTVGTTYGTEGTKVKAAVPAQITCGLAGPYTIVVGVSDAFSFLIDGRAFTGVLTPGVGLTAAAVAADFNTLWLAGPHTGTVAEVVTEGAATRVRIKSPSAYGGVDTSIAIVTVAADCYDVLGFTNAVAPGKLYYGERGSQYMIVAPQSLTGGYDGKESLADTDYTDALNTNLSKFNNLYGKGLGLVKVACPGVTSTAVQKAGVTYVENRGYEWRYELPSSVVTETAAEEYINDTFGRSDFAACIFPGWAYVDDPDSANNLVVRPTVGMVHGVEAAFARAAKGYHKAAADIDAKLTPIRKLIGSFEDTEIDHEILNPAGIAAIAYKHGNFVIWGDRMVASSTGWKWKHKREQTLYYEHILRENMDWIVFALNNTATTAILAGALIGFFKPEYRRGILDGKTFEQACTITCNENNNTESTAAAGDLYAEIRVKIVNVVERVIIRFGQAGIFDDAGL